ncbi:MAG TPA: UvrD-helicase domain-containing protein [Exilispira sp.]|nr:UvrD-helicase domain-containing protein [Exilispira sp.]
MNEFSLDKIELDNRKYLIEASAGTGKTHSMAQIFIRLVLEKYPAEKILLVTFTNSAAEEIKERILLFLIEAKDYLIYRKKEKLNKIKNDTALLKYLDNKRENGIGDEVKNYIKRLDEAIFNFDKIYTCTIHSFAINLVKEFSNEIGLPFQFDFGKDTENIDKILFQKYFIERYENFKDAKTSKEIMSDKRSINDLMKNFKKINKFYDNYKISPKLKGDDINDINEEYLNFYFKNSLNIKKEYGIFNFNDSIDLLIRLFSNNENIRKKVSDRFDALIVDEFQDTDENQVKLFELLFSDKLSFYIGDPKQAIYGFRGGDFVNYLTFKKNIKDDCKFILSKSYRSTPKVIEFINAFSDTIFNKEVKDSNGIENELKKELKYEKIKSYMDDSYNDNESEKNNKSEKNDETDKNKSEAKLIILGKENSTKDIIEFKNIAVWIKNKIEEIEGKDNEFNYEDAAVLIKTKMDIDKYYRIFNEIGLPVALKIDKSVFETDEAIFVYYLLNSIFYKEDIRYIRRLLSTIYFKFTFDQLINNIDKIYSKILPVLEQLQRDWKTYGVYSIFENLFLNDKIKFFGFKGFEINDYERRLTNIRQIFEILTYYVNNRNLSFYNQIEILLRLILEDYEEDTQDFNSMRLESEENAVLISTIHSAKGLEYDTVFCPEIGFESKPRYPKIFYRKNDWFIKDYILDSKNLKSRDSRKKLIKDYENIQDNNLRYVAITRAKKRLYTFISTDPNEENIDKNEDNSKDKNKQNKNDFKSLLIEDYRIEKISVDIDDIKLDENIQKDKNYEDKKLEMEKLIEIPEINLQDYDLKVENIYSYSSISHLKNKVIKSDVDKKDLLDIVVEYKPYKEEEEKDFEEKYSDFKGRLAGNIFHETMEKLIVENFELYKNPFDQNIERIKKISGEMIKKYYKSERIIKIFSDKNLNLVLNTLKTTIPLYNKKIYQLEDLYPEVEFLAKAKDKSLKELYKIFKNLDEKNIIFEEDLILKGYYKGFIDLVFIEDGKINFIDWKTNDLTEYENNFEKAISEYNYDIQYKLYSAILYNFVRSYNLPYEFGNIYYFFVRYVKEDDNSGVYVKVFDKNELEDLCNKIM